MTNNKIVFMSTLLATLIAITSVSIGLQPAQADTRNVDILNLKVDPSIIRVGDTFSINATIINNSTNSISVHNSCGGAFSVVFDNHATVGLKKICNWMAVQIILKPGENVSVTSLASNLGYNASSAGITNATVSVSYVVLNQSSTVLPTNETTISKSFLFSIEDKNNQTGGGAESILYPLQQLRLGTLAKDVQCRDGLQLVFKTSDGSPACVKTTTATKLVLWGWAQLIDGTKDVGQNQTSNKIITLADNDGTISLNKNDRFLLKLGNDFDWNVEIDNQTVVSRVLNIMVINGAQGVYEAHNTGKATLTAIGNPFCLTANPPCKIHSILFKLDLLTLQ